ncbi:nuclear transport factor 2 family protein [Sphingobium algorifonticola]|uniref:Nuclear transport factor 2 family protein n=1 Tax=Sphingobium algorifonticola TaxID=2008318 RepID=A0A437JAL4_9SPHN|nr:nuclear transport factor 2 family protein [Sphingobium algorifonticola]RVT42332.1 nuclear transport factor 2 family protein [Sphingobium algorifonticola]
MCFDTSEYQDRVLQMQAIEVVQQFFDAVSARNIDGALALFSDDAVVESPMGPQRGKAEIRRGLEMMIGMSGGGQTPTLSEDAGKVIAQVQSPMGKISLGFTVNEDDLIAHQSFRMG